MKTLKLFPLFFAIVLLTTNCRKDEIIITESFDPIADVEDVKFQFLITNENGFSIPNAIISIKSETFETDVNGIAISNTYDVPSEGLKAEIEASGYQSLVKMVNGPGNSTKQEKIVLFKSIINVIGTGNSGTIDGGGSLLLPSVLKYADGLDYTGDVTVKSKYLNPDDDDFLLSAPGNMLALNSSKEYKQLASLGMYSIELYDGQGNMLEIPNGSFATISFPIANKHKTSIDFEIPLWYFEKGSGLWQEEGVAKVEGDMLVAQVSHFTWWNCDIPYDFHEICLVFLDVFDKAIPGLDVKFSVNGFDFGYATTNAEGVILAKLPIKEEIDLKYCIQGIEISNQTIGPFEGNERKEYINVDNGILTISGFALDCNMNPVSEGYGFYESDNGIVAIPISKSGIFIYNAPETAHDLILVDIGNSTTAAYQISEENQEVDFVMGNVSVCDDQINTKISGYVLIDTDQDNIGDTPLNDASISIVNKGNNATEIVTTNINGYYEAQLLPGVAYDINYVLEGSYTLIASGDKSPDGDMESDEFRLGEDDKIVMVFNDEHDSDNDFVVIPVGTGQISGSVFGDQDKDGIADIPLEWAVLEVIDRDTNIESILVEKDGSFTTDHIAGYSYLFSFFGSRIPIISNEDVTPDPDGADVNSIPDQNIEVVLYDNEMDDGNNYIHDLSTSSVILCRVLEDLDFDGVGDVPVVDLKIWVSERGNSLLRSFDRTDEFGVRARWNQNLLPGSETQKLTFEIESSEYEIIDIIDTSPDNDPLIIDGDLTKMEIDVDVGEWDAGNIFVVRKK